MKGLFLSVAICLSLASSLPAGEKSNKLRREVTFWCLSPLDIIRGAGCYTLDVGGRVVKGTGQILSAPFKANVCLPRPRVWRWQPGYWTPSRLYRSPEVPTTAPGLNLEVRPMEDDRPLYRPLYYPMPENNRVVLYTIEF